MQTIIRTTLVAAAALVGTAALAENTSFEQRSKLEALWGSDTKVTTGQVSATRNFASPTFERTEKTKAEQIIDRLRRNQTRPSGR